MSPGEHLPIQDPQKGAPLDLISFPEGPWEAAGAPNAPPGTLPGPPWKSTGPNFKKKTFFLKIAETTIYVRFGAFRGKRPPLQNRVFRSLEAPWSPPEAEPFPSRPPPSPPKPTLELPGPPQILQERPGAPKAYIKFTKLACSKPWKYVYLTLRNLKKTLSDVFSTLRVPPGDPPEWRP